MPEPAAPTLPLYGPAWRVFSGSHPQSATLAAVTLTASFAAAVAAYPAAGILNSYFFGATLAARNEYAPAASRDQVFVWIGALKITAGSASTYPPFVVGTLPAPRRIRQLWLPSNPARTAKHPSRLDHAAAPDAKPARAKRRRPGCPNLLKAEPSRVPWTGPGTATTDQTEGTSQCQPSRTRAASTWS
jgi:hypothetical protein